ncbi:hypothetical protein LZQ00_09355 [Sphingobacterium sp. SRCM116780]|uniref:hypothetical protein n=1 Tax=Sphingobacterium sp. SRCM116780 TaxID=2907623 RepID=UPI001F36FCD4|nr:hypothetical protein [Sphingobacterium sp. SRCM116780]UIR54478.1 hypothetical protein LZQ00_09355 [Sphingobacterium sp. SRCM116780]
MNKKLNYYQEISTDVYKRKNQDMQHIIMTAILLGAGAVFFIIKGPQSGAYVFAGIMFLFACGFIAKIGSTVVIDLNRKTIIQKSGLFSSKQTIAFGDIQNFSISNKIYAILLISSAYAIIEHSKKQDGILLGQSLMNTKVTEALLLETETLLGRR